MLRSIKFIILISYSALAFSLQAEAQGVPLPFHHLIDVEIESVELKDGRLHSARFRAKQERGGGRAFKFDENGLRIFTKFEPLAVGQIFQIRVSVLTDQEGGQREVFDVVKKLDAGAAIEAKERVVAEKAGLTHQSYGELQFGQGVAELKDSYKSEGVTLEGCQYVRLEAYPEVAIMIVDDTIVRIDFDDFSSVISETPFADLYSNTIGYETWALQNPSIEIWQHEYVEGYYLIWWSEDEGYGIVAEYTQGKISALRAGVSSHVTLVEGCS